MKEMKIVQRAYVALIFATILFVFVIVVILKLNKGDTLEVKGTFTRDEDIVFSFELENYDADDIEVNEQLFLRDKELNIVYKAVVIKILKIQCEDSNSVLVCDLRILDNEIIDNDGARSMEIIKKSGGILDMLFG